MKILLITLLVIISGDSEAQKIYNTKIQKADKVIITNKIDSQIVYNTENNSTNKIYVLGIDDLTSYVGNKIKENTPQITKFVFGNPDNLTMYDINFTVKFSKAFDSAYFLNVLPVNTKFNPFNTNSPVRDCIKTIAPDKKSVNFKAGYIKAGQLITLLVFSQANVGSTSITIEGAGKLW